MSICDVSLAPLTRSGGTLSDANTLHSPRPKQALGPSAHLGGDSALHIEVGAIYVLRRVSSPSAIMPSYTPTRSVSPSRGAGLFPPIRGRHGRGLCARCPPWANPAASLSRALLSEMPVDVCDSLQVAVCGTCARNVAGVTGCRSAGCAYATRPAFIHASSEHLRRAFIGSRLPDV